MTRFLFLIWLLALPGLLPIDDPEEARFADVFELVDRIRLQEPDGMPLAGVTALDVGPDGRLAVADRASSRIFVFDGTGALQGVLGRPGGGPGEFRRPIDVAFDRRGRLFVADLAFPRITRFSPALRLDTTFRLEEARYPQKVASVGDRLLLYVATPSPGDDRLRFYSPDGERLSSFHPTAPAYRETPYWSAATESRLAASGRTIVAGANLIYPLPVYGIDGTLVDSVGTPPARWIQAPRPERGQFRGPDRFRKFAAWRRTFTTIEAVALVSDRYLLINHEALDSRVLAYEDATFFADVYEYVDERDGWRKRWTGVDLPGRVLRGGDAVYLLETEPPAGWVIGVYRLRR